METQVKYPWGKGRIVWVYDATANDSDKSFTVPDGKIWNLKLIRAILTCSATVGNRVLTALITNGTNVIYCPACSANITASQTGNAEFSPGVTVATSAQYVPGQTGFGANVAIQDNLPDLLLPEGYIVRILDAGGIDVAADDLTVMLHYVEYDA